MVKLFISVVYSLIWFGAIFFFQLVFKNLQSEIVFLRIYYLRTLLYATFSPKKSIDHSTS